MFTYKHMYICYGYYQHDHHQLLILLVHNIYTYIHVYIQISFMSYTLHTVWASYAHSSCNRCMYTYVYIYTCVFKNKGREREWSDCIASYVALLEARSLESRAIIFFHQRGKNTAFIKILCLHLPDNCGHWIPSHENHHAAVPCICIYIYARTNKYTLLLGVYIYIYICISHYVKAIV